MSVRASVYQIHRALLTHLPTVPATPRRALAWWLTGTLLAHSACESAVITALTTDGRDRAAVRQRLRAFCRGERHCATPPLDVSTCFAPLLRWLLSWWHGDTLPLALDATTLRDEVVVLAISVLYRGTAIPVAWHVLAATEKEAWAPHLTRLVQLLAPALPPPLRVLLFTDRGLWSPALWRTAKGHGWHLVMRIQAESIVTPVGERAQVAHTLVTHPGQAWVGRGWAFTRHRRQAGTLIVVWEPGAAAPWVLLSNLAPQAVGVAWYGLRMWIELGFRALKRLGWQWQRSRRVAPERVARHWLVLAVATLWTAAIGTRSEDATARGSAPGSLRRPPREGSAMRVGRRTTSVLTRGWAALLRQVVTGRLWQRLWLVPEALPSPRTLLTIHLHDPPP
jgi:hypothetical protein